MALKPIWFTVLWVAYVVAHMTLSSYLSYRSSGGGSAKWFWFTAVLGLVPVWALVARYSQNLVADAVLYDSLVTVTYFLALLVFTKQLGTLGWWQYLGFLLVLAGTLIIRIK